MHFNRALSLTFLILCHAFVAINPTRVNLLLMTSAFKKKLLFQQVRINSYLRETFSTAEINNFTIISITLGSIFKCYKIAKGLYIYLIKFGS